jgi:hypothetical protein
MLVRAEKGEELLFVSAWGGVLNDCEHRGDGCKIEEPEIQ